MFRVGEGMQICYFLDLYENVRIKMVSKLIY